MNVLAVDDNELSVEILKSLLETVPELDNIVDFTSPEEAIKWLDGNRADIAFLDIIMDTMNGIELAKQIRLHCPMCRIIFCSTSEDFAMDAFRVHADGYITKPVTIEKIREEINHLRIEDGKAEKPLRAQCFGNFELYDSQKAPVRFKHGKSKELFAFLINKNGSPCTRKELAAALYKDRPAEDADKLSNLVGKLISDVSSTLEKLGAGDCLYRTRTEVAAVPDKIDCDYFDFLKGDPNTVTSFHGEYMAQYDWAEATSVYLDIKLMLDIPEL